MARPWRYSRKLKAALLAEFVGMAIFQIYGGNSPDSGMGLMMCPELVQQEMLTAERMKSTSCSRSSWPV